MNNLHIMSVYFVNKSLCFPLAFSCFFFQIHVSHCFCLRHYGILGHFVLLIQTITMFVIFFKHIAVKGEGVGMVILGTEERASRL